MRNGRTSDEAGRSGLAAAWGVHLLTATGVLFALLALDAIHRQSWNAALLWLLVALVVDGVDGSLARRFAVQERLPRIDGDALDLIVDYLNYVLVPTIFMWRAGLLAPGLELLLSALILLSALYVFARRDMKTEDGYFRGFPGIWNVVAVYFFLLEPGPLAGSAVIAALAVATFAPILFVHPFRVSDFGRWLLPTAFVWAASTALLVLPGTSGAAPPLLIVSLATGAVLVGLGLYRTLRGPKPAQPGR